MSKSYQHLSAEERAMLQIETGRGQSVRAISRLLGRSPSTLSRELAKHDSTSYCARSAGKRYRARRQLSVRQRRLTPGTPLFQLVRDHLVLWRWSPQQIAAKLSHMYPDDPAQRVSHETIYPSIYAHPRGGLKKELVQALRQHKPKRGWRRTTAATRSWVPEELRIVHRPEEVQTRLVPGHWEGDLIKGAFNRSCVGTLVERKTRFVVLCRMDGCTAADALEGFTRQMKKLPASMRTSLTYDRGTELTCYAELMQGLNIDVWFADPHAPWQRGSNENTNGLLRQFLPKGADLSTVSQEYLNHIALLMNTRPRQTLGWKTPSEAMEEEIAALKSCVALES
ncbi:IS30 family transposase [Xanthomonas oryzae pv. oryzae]|uniref:IS30 family transposase n=1 Tax=Xanthomonas oryzae TaxID=347 RepID=UPI000C7BEA7A|nr:IS30 family transposase [Xanthomonas oryzae]AUI92451.1 IS30 family transposase [Xanthomonas oryzae pv. oryzae]AUI96128.1 IS30 family transposase [Xanthomonas oryzae pv. oryzae]AUI99800.1 IS30 family transposase [Xanthomonas oryzae pv. oryzae]AUJ03477.1 IS30 family transposase [Xanthomonas oryzae pv. oryzae]AUJ07144.1 IS30 family transposase [Xanthomonas oryzae pv. oryzae]